MTKTGSRKIGITLAAALAFQGGMALAAESRFEIDLKELPKATAPRTRKHAEPSGGSKPARSLARKGTTDGTTRYVVKSGDHIFKILMRDFGLSNRQAELLIPEIARLNGIDDIRRLRVGQVLLIPSTPSHRGTGSPEPKGAAEAGAALQPAPAEEPQAESSTPAASQALAPTPVPTPAAAPPPPTEPPVAAAPQPVTADAPTKPAPVVVSPVNATERDGIVDAVLDLLAPGWARNRIIEGGKESTDGSYVSIKVDRYFEHLGYRYIVNSGSDPMTLTLLRLLEVQGDRVINVGRDETAVGMASRLAAKMELPQQEGSFRVRCLDAPGAEIAVRGIRVSPGGPYGQQLLITGEQVPKCTAELLAGAETPLAVK